MRYVYLLIAVAGMFLLSYLTIGKEMNMVILGAGMVLLFLICFFSVKISLILLILSMTLSPEIAVGATAKRAISARIEDVLLLIMTVSWMVRMAIFKDIGFMLKTQLSRPIITYSMIAILATTMGVLRGNVQAAPGFFFTLKIIEYFFLFNVVVNFIQTEKEIENLLNLLLGVCGIICIYSMLMVASGGDISAPFEGSTGERNTLSGYLVLMGAVAGGVLMNTKIGLEKTLLSILLFFIIIVLLFSLSRSGWISSIIAIGVLFACAKQKNMYFMILAVMLFTIPFLLPQVAHERINFTFHQTARVVEQFQIFGIRLDTSTSARIFAAQAVLNQFIKHPFFGFGMTGAFFIDGQFFRVLLEMGILGLGAFIWLLTNVHNVIRRTMHMELSSRLHGMVVGFYAGFWALIFHAFSANTFIIVRISEPFWCLTGLTVLLLTIKRTKAETATTITENKPGMILI
jgi:O-antigen ligase